MENYQVITRVRGGEEVVVCDWFSRKFPIKKPYRSDEPSFGEMNARKGYYSLARDDGQDFRNIYMFAPILTDGKNAIIPSGWSVVDKQLKNSLDDIRERSSGLSRGMRS